eukprot:13066912-Heterocapsa_arctica.AAC.1
MRVLLRLKIGLSSNTIVEHDQRVARSLNVIMRTSGFKLASVSFEHLTVKNKTKSPPTVM